MIGMQKVTVEKYGVESRVEIRSSSNRLNLLEPVEYYQFFQSGFLPLFNCIDVFVPQKVSQKKREKKRKREKYKKREREDREGDDSSHSVDDKEIRRMSKPM